MLPSVSIFMPSGAPGPAPVVSAHTRPLASVPSGFTSNSADVLAVGIVDVELCLVPGEAQAVGLAEIVGEQGQPAAVRLGAIDAAEIELRLGRGLP